MTPPAATSQWSVFRYRDFTLFWSAALVSNSAQWMQQLAVPILMFELTDSNTWVGAAAFSILIPGFILNPVAGVIADRASRRVVMMFTLSAQTFVTIGFAVLWANDALTPWAILTLGLCQGLASGIQIAAWQSLVPLLVPPEHLLTAVRLNSAQFIAARALGPLVGAGILALVGIGTVFIVNGATFVMLLAVVASIRPRTTSPPSTEPPMKVFREGLNYVAARRPLLQAIWVGFSISFFGQALVQIAAGLARQDYRVGEVGLAGFYTSVGIGSVIASLVLIAVGDNLPRSRVALVGYAVYAVGIMLAAATTNYMVGLGGFLIMGIAHVTIAISVNTAVQIQVSEAVRGRVMSIYLMSIFGGIPLGAFAWGSLGDLFGMRWVYLMSGFLMAMFLLFAIFVLKSLKEIDANEDTAGQDLEDFAEK